MKISLPKLKAMLLFFSTYTDKRLLGKTKLMKLFYFADFGHTKKYGSPITYDTYYHLDHGPIPSVVKNLVDEVDDDFDSAALSDVISVEHREDSLLKRVIPARDFKEEDMRHFSDTELEVMKSVCKRFDTANAKQLEEASHKEAPWTETKFSEEISYLLATKDKDASVSEEEVKLLLEITNE